MPFKREPTTRKNVVARLFFRFFLCYVAALTVAILMDRAGLLSYRVTHVGKGEAVLVLLALLAALLTVSKPYLLCLSAVKAFYDVAWFSPLMSAATLTAQGGLAFIAAFFYLAFSLLLFAGAAARSCLFATGNYRRDTQLLVSRSFWGFLLEAVFFAALSSVLFFIWSPLVALFV